MKALKKENRLSSQSVFSFACVCPWPGSCGTCTACGCSGSLSMSASAFNGGSAAINIVNRGGTASTQ